MKILTIVPTRSRPEQSVEFYNQFAETTGVSDLCFGLDDDDVEYPRIDGVIYEVNPRMWMNGTLNHIANKYQSEYDYIAFMGDDHRPRTQNWDIKLAESIAGIKNGIAYGNDLWQGENLPTAVLLDTRIINTLGYMTPPKQKHLYLDDFWRDLGRDLGTLRYNPDVILEHMHFTAGKSESDDLYQEVNSGAMFDHDSQMYNLYKMHEFNNDLAALRDN
jgi:hypothetical protein